MVRILFLSSSSNQSRVSSYRSPSYQHSFECVLYGALLTFGLT